jgi:hypothetical protein
MCAAPACSCASASSPSLFSTPYFGLHSDARKGQQTTPTPNKPLALQQRSRSIEIFFFMMSVSITVLYQRTVQNMAVAIALCDLHMLGIRAIFDPAKHSSLGVFFTVILRNQ